jgi:hypothetical protein
MVNVVPQIGDAIINTKTNPNCFSKERHFNDSDFDTFHVISLERAPR